MHSSHDRLHRQYKAAHHSLEADADFQHGGSLCFILLMVVSKGVQGGHVSASRCMGGFRVATQQLCAAGWPGFLLDPGPIAFLRLAQAFPRRLAAGPRCAQ